MTKFDYNRLRGRLGGAADLELANCTSCGRQYLVDHAQLRVYPDAEDLEKYFLNAVGHCPPCVACHDVDWDFERAARIAPEWRRWVLPRKNG